MGLGGAERGCGKSREAGGIYLECGSAEGFGLPMWELIQDPVVPVDPKVLGLSPVGVKLVEMDGVWHVFDWVGEKHYPNAADFIEEAVRLGISRRISKTAEFAKLTHESKLFLVHPKAVVEGSPEWLERRIYPCPTGKHDPEEQEDCAGVLWVLGDPFSAPVPDIGPEVGTLFPEWGPSPVEVTTRTGVRKMPAFDYLLEERPHEVGLRLLPGVIMAAPIERIAVVEDPDDSEATSSALEIASNSGLPVRLEDE